MFNLPDKVGLSDINQLFLRDFAIKDGVYAGKLTYRFDIDSKDAYGQSRVFAYVALCSEHAEIYIKQKVYDPDKDSTSYIRHSVFAVSLDGNFAMAIQKELNKIFAE